MNLVNIAPADMEMKLRLEAWSILNEFRGLGFYKRNAFLSIVKFYCPEYKDQTNEDALNRFWASRNFDQELLSDLRSVLDKLKSE